MKTITVHTDGGARGNPGPAGAGVVLMNEKGKVLARESKFLGTQTNNTAEYEAVIIALEKAVEMFGNKTKEMQFNVYLDIELVTRQLKSFVPRRFPI